MTRASDWRSPSSDLITKGSLADQSLPVTTRAPPLLMFSVTVNSVLDVSSRLVSMTATAATLLSSDRLGCIAMEQRSVWFYGVRLKEKAPTSAPPMIDVMEAVATGLPKNPSVPDCFWNAVQHAAP